MNSHHFRAQHPPIGPSKGSTLLCVRNKLHLVHIKDVRNFSLNRAIEIPLPYRMQHVPQERGYFQQVSWDHILEGSTFPNKYNLKNRKRTPIILDFKLSPCLECCMLSFG
jgi:hypothetical protein